MNTPIEIWRPITGFPGYEVSDLGRVRSTVTRLIGPQGSLVLKASPNDKGYLHVSLCRQPGRTTRKIHKLVAEAFLGPRPPKHDINHKDGNKTNNQVGNLEWISRSGNCKHAYRLGLSNSKGERCPSHKLTEEQVREIRMRRQQGETFSAIAGDFGVTNSAICNVCTRRNWSHVV